jgi:hypothetical protein
VARLVTLAFALVLVREVEVARRCFVFVAFFGIGAFAFFMPGDGTF